jgi:rubredoxin
MKHRCTICEYVYDDEAEGTPFNDLPDDWVCPVCNASKEDFEPVS